MKNVAIIGGGNLGGALAGGLKYQPEYQITVTGRSKERLQKYTEWNLKVSTDNVSTVSTADIIIMCLPPDQLLAVLGTIAHVLTPEKLLISTATGVSLAEIEEVTKNSCRVARAMPNTAAAVGLSMTAVSIAGDTGQDEEIKKTIHEIFDRIGEVLLIDDSMMQAATVLGASGVAFFLRYIRAATQGGIQMGFHPDEAQRMVVQVAAGAAGLMARNEVHPEQEIDKVTTPRGCTIEGLNEMEHQGLSSAVIKGLMASYHKIKNIR